MTALAVEQISLKTPHEHQSDAIALLRMALRDGSKRPLLQAPTGFGKTLVAAWIIQGALAKGNSVIFTVPAIGLVDQTVRAFWEEGIRRVGVIQADHPMTDPAQPVQVATPQTLAKRTIPKAGLVLVDEAHRIDRFLIGWMQREAWKNIPFVGLSATPWTKGLGSVFDRLIVAATTAELIDQGFLAPFKAYAPAHPDLTGVKTIAGDFHEGQLSAAMQRGSLVGDLVETWIKRGNGRPTFVFAVDLAHARVIQRQFAAAGIDCGYLDASSSRQERERLRRGFAQGDPRVIVNVGVLTTGIDWDVRCIVLARPTKSEILYTQILGRGLRKAPGKDHLLILDHSDSTLRLGFVTDIRHDYLDGGRVSDPSALPKPPKPHECKACSYLIPAGVFKCPACGYEAERLPSVKTTTGEIVELDAKRRDRENREASWPEKTAFMAGLKRYQILTSKKEGWVAHKYKERFGVWPNDQRLKYVEAADVVPPNVSSWIRSRNIAWANRRDG